MRPKRGPAPAAELGVVLLMTALAFVRGQQAAQDVRGYHAIGGEFLLLFLPAVYYIGKRTVRDWTADLRKQWEEWGSSWERDVAQTQGGKDEQ